MPHSADAEVWLRGGPGGSWEHIPLVPTADPIVFAAQLLGVESPPEIPFDQVAPTMSPMALSFWQECRRVHNDKLKRVLGVRLLYPTYREGLRALHTGAASEGLGL